MNEGLHANGITLGGNWDTEATLQKDLSIGFGENKIMNGSSSSSPTAGDNSTSSVSTMLESLRSNLSQIYSGENLEAPSYPMNIKTESPVRGPDFCNDENTFSHQRDQLSNDVSQTFDIYNPAITSVSSSTMQRQFSPYDTNNMINNALFSQQQGYPSYPLPVKPEPSSPSPNFQLSPYYLSNSQAIYPPTTMNLNQIDYQGYRLSDMMLPTFSNTQDQLNIKQEKYPTLNPESDPVLTQQLLGLNGANGEGDHGHHMKPGADYPAHTEHVSGPMRIRRIKRPIPAGPSYPVHLWQFILELLGDHSCKDFIAWTGNDLEFKVINSRELARRWGRRKNNARMNFDKLSRAMRYYYEKNIIKHIPGQRLVYRYCRNPDDIVFTQLLKTAMGTLPPETRLIAPVTTNPHFTNAHSLGGSFNQLTSSNFNSPTSHMGAQLTNSTLNSTSSLMNQTSPLQPTGLSGLAGLSNAGTTITSGLSAGLTNSGLAAAGLTNSANSNMTEYMFSANCLTQVQQHLQQSADGVKHHHMMAS